MDSIQQLEAEYLRLLQRFDQGHRELKKMKQEMQRLRTEIEKLKLKPKP